MPLPFGHSMMGYALHEATAEKDRRLDWRSVLLFIAVANLPDIDFVPGFFVGDPNRYHHHYLSHSLGFALFVGVVIGAVSALRFRKRFLPSFFTFSFVCFSHLILDFLTADYSEPHGLPMFWPITSDYFYSPVSVFMSVNKGGPNLEFIQSLFVWHNAWVILWEIAVLGPVVVFVTAMKNKIWMSSQLKRARSSSG